MAQLSTAVNPPPISSYAKVVIDAGPLISILVLKYAFTLEPDAANAAINRSAVAPYLRTDSAQRAMIRLFDRIRAITTTSHVIGELQGLQKLTGNSQDAFWRAAMNWLAVKGFDENLIRLLDLNSHPRGQNWVHTIGPTDSGLLELALRERTALLTDDQRTIAWRARQNGIDCRLVEDELAAVSM